MNAKLTVTTTHKDGYVETQTFEWPGYTAQQAAREMRKRRGVKGTALTYDPPLTVGDRERGAIHIHHEWTEGDQE